MHQKDKIKLNTIGIIKSLKKRNDKIEIRSLFTQLSELFTELSEQLQLNNKKGKLLSWHINFESIDDEPTQSEHFKFNLEFRDKSKALIDLNVTVAETGEVRIDGGIIDPKMAVNHAPAGVAALTNSPAFSKYFTSTKDIAIDKLYRLKSILSPAQISTISMQESLYDIVTQIGLFFDLMLDRIPQKSIVA